ncbi:MAG: FAD-dependent oxidoreductase [Cyclobacteriaceae bacterium]
MLSFWEKDSFINYDVIVIGAGITGLSTAASLKEKSPELSVLVLERGLLPTGASTKNAGFACFGSLTELLADLETMTEAEMLALVEMRWQGLAKTRKRLGDNTIDYQNKGGYELFFQNDHRLNQLDKLNDLLKSKFDRPVYRLENDQIEKFGFGGTKHLIFNQYEGQLHTGKLIKSLWQYCSELGVQVITGADVQKINEEENFVQVKASGMSWQAKRVAVCTNAFSNAILKEPKDIQPGRGLVLAITPSIPLKFEGTFHYDEGYFYFRNYGNKIIFGGGRNIDRATENTTSFDINNHIKDKLLQDLQNIIIPDQKFEITDIWTGIMAFGPNKSPIITQVSDKIHIGVRLGGMGVAIGSQVGEALASQMIAKFF